MKDYHRLLRRQIKKLNLETECFERYGDLLDLVDEAYRNFDQDHLHLENILEKSSQELFKANKKLKEDVRLKELEVFQINQQLDRVMNNIREIIFQTDLNGNWIYLNNAWEEISGFKVEDSLGKNFEDYLESVLEEDRDFIKDLATSKFSETSGVFRFHHKDNQIRWIELRMRITRDANGISDGTIGTMVDITNLKQTEKALIQAKEIAINASKAKNEFLSTMSHEIRTPMNAVIGINNILMMNDPRPDQMDNLLALKHSSEHLLSLINDVLDFSKIEAGKIVFDHSEFNLQILLDDLKNTYSYSANQKGIRLILKKDDQLPTILIGDSTRLTQILTNLLSNAIKFTNEGRVVLDVELIEESENELILQFEIRDTGIGIKKDKIDLIFRSFEQAEKTISKDFGGTGLGLSICKKLLELQGSELKVKSEYTKGSTFYFQLKFGKTNTEKKDHPDPRKFNTSYEAIGQMKVLLVEDNKFNILVVEKLLANWNVNLDVAQSGKQALEMVQQNNYQLILMDLRMPMMDGYTTAKLIRKLPHERFREIPIIACTASFRQDVIDNVKRAGMDDFLSKPYDPGDLHNIIKRYEISKN